MRFGQQEPIAELQEIGGLKIGSRSALLSAFVRVDCENGAVTRLDPPPTAIEVKPAACFGDNWLEPLGREDKLKLTSYFQAKQILRSHLGFLRFVVGGVETVIDLNPDLRQLGITFEVPRLVDDRRRVSGL
jgi:hypothetical protein